MSFWSENLEKLRIVFSLFKTPTSVYPGFARKPGEAEVTFAHANVEPQLLKVWGGHLEKLRFLISLPQKPHLNLSRFWLLISGCVLVRWLLAACWLAALPAGCVVAWLVVGWLLAACLVLPD